MNSNLKTILFIIIGVLILGIFLKILPYIIIGSVCIYLGVKGYKYIKSKFNKSDKNINSEKHTYIRRDSENHVDEEFDTSSAIDVDYKDVK